MDGLYQWLVRVLVADRAANLHDCACKGAVGRQVARPAAHHDVVLCRHIVTMLDQMKQHVERAGFQGPDQSTAHDLPATSMHDAVLEPGHNPPWYGALSEYGGTHGKPVLIRSREAWPHGKTIIRCR